LIARVAVAAFFALASTACQTPWSNAVLREASSPAAVASLAPSLAMPEPAPAEIAAPVMVEIEVPTLEQRIAALLVKRAPKMQPVDRLRVAGAIHTAHQTHGVDPLLVLAIIEQESTFRTDARGLHGSVGLMQVRPFVGADVAKRHNIPWKGAKTLLDPAANVQIGACYLGEMLEMHGDPALAIAAYNMGPYRVQRMVKRGHHPRPKYLISVLKRLQGLATEFGPLPDDPIQDASAE
jgi:soluble lytic murein transglycosylase-like protein